MVSLTFLSTVATALLSVVSAQSDFYSYDDKQFSQTALDQYNALRFLGGLGPYVDRTGVGISRDPPSGCEVDQVFMLHRHGERYPDPVSGATFVGALSKLTTFNKGSTNFQGTLSFLSSWDNYLDEPSYFNQETWTGPYAGLNNLYNRGANYRARYGHLWDEQSPVPIFASGYERIVNSARKFGEGFFGYNYSTIAQMQIIPETGDQGANSLTPTCFIDYNPPEPSVSSFPQFATAAARLNAEYPGLNLTDEDAYNLMAIGSYDLNTKPVSPWINVFTLEEWLAYRYMNDVFYYYYSGPGNPGGIPSGAVWAKAVSELLNKGPSSSSGSFSNTSESVGSMYWSFCHDTNVVPVVSALGLAKAKKHLPVDQIAFEPDFISTQIVPMGGHLTVERLKCSSSASPAVANGTIPAGSSSYFVRAIINEAVVPWDDCASGPGFSCPLAQFTKKINKLPDYVKECKVPKGYPTETTFFTNYNHSTQFNYKQGPIPYQEAAVSWNEQAINL